jgi:hypothetical protein
MFTSKMDKKNRIVKTWSPTRTMRAMGVGTQISLPLVMVGSPQAMYMAKMRLNAECGWEQWLVKVTEVVDAKGMPRKRVVVERRTRPTDFPLQPPTAAVSDEQNMKGKKGGHEDD